ncbi:MAG TPA: serine/threonine-protein kinase [Gemmataceae bacterium]|nr:serine/threonine-protein kinase [Gemmataceae bacterium]
MSDPIKTEALGRDERLAEILLGYLEAAQDGTAPDRRRLLADHPDFAADLEEFFAGRDQMDLLAAQMRDDAGLSALPHSSPLLNRRAGAAPLGEIGDFRVLREIGRGGMAVVYEAEQISLGRRVALKMLPFAAALDPKQLQRFKNEAQAAAHLHHPNIVPVYAIGYERGVPYYAMQFINGQSLAALIEELRQQTGREDRGSKIEDRGSKRGAGSTLAQLGPLSRTLFGDSRSSILDPRSSIFHRVALLAKRAAEALEHAHQFGIVHRDIKPANLLLDAHGNLWVTDFGLALMQSDTALTATGEVLGTLRYMSPEQAAARRGVVDHRTDIYALGVTLYELLTLRPVFDGADRHELLSHIAFDEPTPPHVIDRSIPAELETVVLKAMAKEPAERYATAQDLADDLQRFLDDKPILARRPTLLERARKWSRRHRAVVVCASILLLVALVALLVSTLVIASAHGRTLAAYEAERARAREAEQQRKRAEESFQQARRLVDFFTQVCEQELADMPPLQGLRKRLLEAALDYYQDFIDQRRDDPSIQAALAASHAQVTKLLGELTALQGSGRFFLLTDRLVQQELDLNEEQRRKTEGLAKEFARRWRADFFARPKPSAQERRARSLELVRTTEKALAEILTVAQDRRLKQIDLQVRQQGPHGFTAPEIAGALKLTARQKEQIRAVQDEAHVAFMERLQRGPWPPPPGKPLEDPWGGVRAKVLDLLTPQQRERWRELTGEPIKGHVRFMPFGPDAPFPPPVFGPSGFGPPPGLPGPGFRSPDQ